MKITVFTSNQPRHLALISRLAAVSTETYAVVESNTVFPGKIEDFYKKSDVMQRYFENVIAAESLQFGDIAFSKSNVKTLSLKSGDLNFLSKQQLKGAMSSDIYVVFGASYIRGWLIDHLINNNAINIHVGLSPYYRGCSCNFWALYDGKPEYVGSTIHLLSRGLDSGPMLYHAVPTVADSSPYEFTMRAVKAAQESLVERISNKQIFDCLPRQQDKSKEIRYTRRLDFTDDVAAEYLSRNLSIGDLGSALSSATKPELLTPFYY